MWLSVSSHHEKFAIQMSVKKRDKKKFDITQGADTCEAELHQALDNSVERRKQVRKEQ